WSQVAPIAKHKKIAKAVDVLDRATLQAVVFLRNVPVARAFFLAYLILLHVWAFVVLGMHSHSINGNDPLVEHMLTGVALASGEVAGGDREEGAVPSGPG
ncbi:unnamed protein product, partial [Discosporangium mesarthrocarpum]